MSKLYVVATPIGNLSDISARALETLESVSLIAAEDTRRTLKLLSHFSIRTPVVSYHKFNEREKGQALLDKLLLENADVALVSDAGTPCISDPGCVLVALARNAGVEVVAVPGASAVVSALSVCGFEFRSFAFLGFIPKEKKERAAYYAPAAAGSADVFVLFESPQRIVESLRELAERFPNGEAFVINDITKYYERAYRGAAAEVAAQLEREPNRGLGEYTLVLRPGETAREPREEAPLTAEALLVNELCLTRCSMKEAVKAVCERNKALRKNEVYQAALRLKELL